MPSRCSTRSSSQSMCGSDSRLGIEFTRDNHPSPIHERRVGSTGRPRERERPPALAGGGTAAFRPPNRLPAGWRACRA
jgi:hypothetical protein